MGSNQCLAGGSLGIRLSVAWRNVWRAHGRREGGLRDSHSESDSTAVLLRATVRSSVYPLMTTTSSHHVLPKTIQRPPDHVAEMCVTYRGTRI